MKLIRKIDETRLKRNAKKALAGESALDHLPVVKLFTPWGAATWLITEIDEYGIAFGLCDLGLGTPELGYVDIGELKSLVGPYGLKVERDIHFETSKPLRHYVEVANEKGRIVA